LLRVPGGGTATWLEVPALAGFAWGSRIRDREIRLVPPTLRGPAEWHHHVDAVAARYLSWRFISGFRQD